MLIVKRQLARAASTIYKTRANFLNQIKQMTIHLQEQINQLVFQKPFMSVNMPVTENKDKNLLEAGKDCQYDLKKTLEPLLALETISTRFMEAVLCG